MKGTPKNDSITISDEMWETVTPNKYLVLISSLYLNTF